MVHSSKSNSSCIFNNIPSNCFKTHKQVQMLYTRDIAASFQVLTPHGVPLDNKQPKSQRSKRWWFNFAYIFYWYFRLIKMSENRFFFYQEFQCFNGDRLSLSLKWTKDRKQKVWQKPNIVTNKDRMLLKKNPFVEPLISFVA